MLELEKAIAKVNQSQKVCLAILMLTVITFAIINYLAAVA